jgi:hypothetical protein
MGKHVLASAGALAAVIAIGSLASTPVAGQATTGKTAASAGKTARWTPPKTPWGDPDLQGNLTNIYEVNTPFERPDEFQGRKLEEVKGEELVTIRRRQQEEAEKRRLSAPGVQGGTPEIWLNAFDHTKGSMAWFVTDPPDGKIPPQTPQAQARAAARAAVRSAIGNDPADSIEDRSLYDQCISRGLPGSMMPAPYGNSYQIVQAPGYVAIRYEMVHETRIIPLDGRPHLDPNVRQWMGDARGRWEGNTLVVETRNFREELTPRGANPKTLKMTERFTRVAPDKIYWSTTYDDPETWTRPWTQTIPLTIDDSQAIVEYACHEGNYSMWNTLTGHRTEEHAAAAQKSGR